MWNIIKRVFTAVSVYAFACACVFASACMCLCMHACLCACVCVHTCVHACLANQKVKSSQKWKSLKMLFYFFICIQWKWSRSGEVRWTTWIPISKGFIQCHKCPPYQSLYLAKLQIVLLVQMYDKSYMFIFLRQNRLPQQFTHMNTSLLIVIYL